MQALSVAAPRFAVVHVPFGVATVAEPLLGRKSRNTSLFAAPTICVVSVPEVPATDVLDVVIARMQLPGVLVEVTVKETVPLPAVAEPLPAENVAPLPPGPVVTAVMLQLFAELESRLAVRTVELSLNTVLPFASWMTTLNVEVEVVSAAIGLRLQAPEVLADAPGAVVATIELQPVSEPPETETCALPVLVVVVAVTEATPFDGVTGFVQPWTMSVGVTSVKVRFGELALLTVLPFASLSVAVNTIVLLPFATVVVGLALQEICEAGPKTVIGAEAERPSELAALTEHGCVAEFVAVAAKRPALVTAPQPPVTDHVMVAPADAPLAVNCWVPPTGSEAEVGERVKPPVPEGVVLIWK